MNKFNIKKDIKVVNAGGFFCQACLVGKLANELSLDPRYCQGCYNLLVEEAKMITSWRKPSWVPKVPQTINTVW